MAKILNCQCGAKAELAQTRHKVPRYWVRCSRRSRCYKQPDCFEEESAEVAVRQWNKIMAVPAFSIDDTAAHDARLGRK